MKDFLFKSPTKIKFGCNQALNIGEVMNELKVSKPFVVTDKIIAKLDSFNKIVESLKKEGYSVTVFDDTEPDPPIEVCDNAAQILKDSNCDVVIAVGGGSPIDTAKAMCMLVNNEGSVRDYLFGGTKTVTNESMPLICVPTTAGSGSEVTAASVITDNDNNIKLSVTHEYIIPKYAIIDPMMHIGMPAFITATTGIDALTHAIEAYVSLNANIYSDAYAEMAMKLIGENLRTAVHNPTNIEARSKMALASTLAATAFVNGGLGAVHGISQALGGVAHVAHGVGNSMMLPYVMELNIPGNIEKFANIAKYLGGNVDGLSLREAAEISVKCVKQLSEDVKIPKKLSEVKVTKDMFDSVVKGTMEYRLLAINPVKITEENVYDILNKAY